MTIPSTPFDDRARALTQSLLAEAARNPSRVPLDRRSRAPWKAIAAFAATVLIIGGAVVGASWALRSAPIRTLPADALASRWTAFQLPPMGASTDTLSCPSAHLCVAGDYAGNIYASTNPAGGTSAWTVIPVDPSTAVTGVSCADPSLCVAVDQNGNVITSTHPTRGAGAWTVSGIDGRMMVAGIACPDEHLCVAVGGSKASLSASGLVLASANPKGGPGTWTVTELPATGALTAISCPSAVFCVATDSNRDILTTTNPTGGATAWTVTRVAFAPDSFVAISCPSIFLCVAVDSSGNVGTSTDPAVAAAWTLTNLRDGSTDLPLFDTVSCASVRFCVLGSGSPSVQMSTDPTGGASAWTAVPVMLQGRVMLGLSCPTSGFCAGVDGSDGFHVYTNPGG
jgi:hypothetical protein